MLALPTCHMIAATVLFDRGTALGAFFRVRRDPVRRFRIILAFLHPHLHQRTGRWLVIHQGAAKAKPVGAVAGDSGYNLVQLLSLDATFDGVLTIWGGTPLKIV